MDNYTPESSETEPPIQRGLLEALGDASIIDALPIVKPGFPTPAYRVRVRLREDDEERFDLAVEHEEPPAEGEKKGAIVVDELFESLTIDSVREAVNTGSKLVMVTDVVQEKIRKAKAVEEAARRVEANRKKLAADFGQIIADARPAPGKPVDEVKVSVAAAKLRVFGSYSDEGVGMRMALLNRAQRLRVASDNRHAAGDRKRKVERIKRIKSKRKNRRG